jgi:hypothetical protein
MSTKLARFGPITAVAGLLGYLCWPYLDEPVTAPKSKGAPKAVELPTALLAPPEAPDLDHDPFGSRAASAPPVTKLTSAAKSASAAKVSGPVSASTKPEGAAKTTAALTVSAPSTLVLSGTYIRGNRRVAVINDSLYSEGEQISTSLATVPNCSVARVDIDRVLLNVAGKTAELSYPNPMDSSAAADSNARGMANAAKTSPQSNRKTGDEERTKARARSSGPPKVAPAAPPPLGPSGADTSRPNAVSDASDTTN